MMYKDHDYDAVFFITTQLTHIYVRIGNLPIYM